MESSCLVLAGSVCLPWQIPQCSRSAVLRKANSVTGQPASESPQETRPLMTLNRIPVEKHQLFSSLYGFFDVGLQFMSRNLMGRILYKSLRDSSTALLWMQLGKFIQIRLLRARLAIKLFHFCRVVYVWGYNGYCRLGLGNQVDILKPKAVPQVSYLIFSDVFLR